MNEPAGDPADGNDATALADDYQRAGFNQRLGFGDRPAVVIVDMCVAYFDPDSPLYAGVPDVVGACRSLVDTARSADVPVIWTRVEYEPGGANGGIFYRKVGALKAFDRGNPLGDWIPELTPLATETVITKQYASAFFDTPLTATLQEQSIDTVVIGGVSTSGCVRATALDACQSGFVPIVASEACGDRDPAVHTASLFDLDAKYSDVEPLAHVLTMLTA